MAYFKNFPQIFYSFSTGNLIEAFVMTDILARVKVNNANLLNTLSYDEYDILDGETPEIIADKVYNRSDYHWLILIANEIIDPRYDWPLSNAALHNYVTDTYGAGNEYAIHHYINAVGDVVHSSYTDGTKYPVTNFDYEDQINESKRRIQLIKPQFVSQFIQNFVGTLNNGGR